MEKHANHKHLGVYVIHHYYIQLVLTLPFSYYKCTECGYKAAQKDAVETHASNMQ